MEAGALTIALPIIAPGTVEPVVIVPDGNSRDVKVMDELVTKAVVLGAMETAEMV